MELGYKGRIREWVQVLGAWTPPKKEKPMAD
jgi:hypothetical protein